MIFKLIKLNFIVIIISFFSVSTSQASNYCLDGNKKISINYVISKHYSSSEKRAHLIAIDQIMSEINDGDFLQFSITTKDNTVSPVKKCYPGCPPKTATEQIFGIGDKCNITRMKRERKNLTATIVNTFSKISKKGEIIDDGVTDIFLTLESISKFQKNKEFDKSYIINSMNPFNNNKIISDKELDELFVKIVSENRVPKDLPEAVFTGLTQNSKIISFWTDIFAINNKKFIYQ